MRHASLLCVLVMGCPASHPLVLSDAGIPRRDAAATDTGLAPLDAGALRDVAAAVDIGVSMDAAHATDGGLPLAAGRITCGTTECEPGRGCLASCLDATDERMPACLADGVWPAESCPTGRETFPRAWLRCDGAEDCASGEWCYLVFGSSGQFAQCGACTEPCSFVTFHPLCRTEADCPAEVPRCLPTSELPGYSICFI